MAKSKPKKTIFFIVGVEATAEELAEANKFNPGVVLRSAAFIKRGDPIEPFDEVAGAVPEDYVDADGTPAPIMSKRARRAALAAQGEAPASKAVELRRVPSVPETPPQAAQGGAWGAAPPVKAVTPPKPGTPPVWKPNA